MKIAYVLDIDFIAIKQYPVPDAWLPGDRIEGTKQCGMLVSIPTQSSTSFTDKEVAVETLKEALFDKLNDTTKELHAIREKEKYQEATVAEAAMRLHRLRDKQFRGEF